MSALRKRQGLSQHALAQMLGTTRDNLAYYERKAEHPSLDFIERCAQALQVSPSELIGDEGKTRSAKPGPPARLEQLSRRLASLPRGKQQVVIEMLEGLLQKAGTLNAFIHTFLTALLRTAIGTTLRGAPVTNHAIAVDHPGISGNVPQEVLPNVPSTFMAVLLRKFT